MERNGEGKRKEVGSWRDRGKRGGRSWGRERRGGNTVTCLPDRLGGGVMIT